MTLRRFILGAVAVMVLATVTGMVGVLHTMTRMQDDLESESQALLEEQQTADRLVTTVYQQLLDASHFLIDEDPATIERFRLRGREAYDGIRRYLFRDLSAAQRLQVETIKELHQELEVAAQHTFDLALRDELPSARAETEELYSRAAVLQQAVDRFIEMRAESRAVLRAEQSLTLRRIYFGSLLVAAVLILGLLLLTRFLQQRLLRPLEELSSAAGRLGGGDLTARVPVHHADELGAVARSFNAMAGSLQVARDELHVRNVELAEALDRLQRTQQELVQSEKMSAMGVMLAGLAHELNNPLASVLGYSELLAARLERVHDEDAASLAELTRPLVQECIRARDLVRNLLEFSRRSGAALEVVALERALDVVLALRSYAFAQAGIALDVDLEPGLHVRAESQRLQQAFVNILNNALDALCGGKGSRLQIRGAATDHGWVSLVFEDDGPGLADAERVFDPFYTTKPVGQGTGLGLALVHQFVHEFGGSITAANRREGGARFVLRLRAAEPSTAASAAAAPAGADDAAVAVEADAAGRRPRVLLVEDEEPVRLLQLRMLAKLAVEVTTAATGAEAQELLSREKIDLVVSDVKMPGDVNGVALFEWVSREQPDLAERFLFVTGDIYDPALGPLLDAHPDRFITKPFRVDEYVERVARALGRAPVS